MKQLILGKASVSNGVLGDFPVYTPLRGGYWAAVFSLAPNRLFRYSHTWSVAGTFKSLFMEQRFINDVNSGGGWSAIPITLYINDAPTALTVTIPAHAAGTPGTGFTSTAMDLSHSVHINPGDRVCLAMDTCSMTFGPNFQGLTTQWSLVFESDNPRESGYGLPSSGGGASAALNRLYAPFFGSVNGFGIDNDAIINTYAHNIVPLEGSATRIDVACDIAPGVGAARRFVLSLNNVFQDGTGGTVNTLATISGTNTKAFIEFDCPVHVTDRLAVAELVESVAPANALVQGSVRFRATTDGQFAIAGTIPGPGTAVGSVLTDYAANWEYGWAWSTANAPTPGVGPNRWPMQEVDISFPGPAIDPFRVTSLYVNVDIVVSGSLTFMTRRALADTPSICVVTGAGFVFTGSGSTPAYTSPADRWDLQSVASDGATFVHMNWTWLVVAGLPALTLTKSHTDPFFQGQLNATYTIVVTNTGDSPTVGVQTVTDTVPAGLTLVSMAGAGWTCVGNVCTRSDALAVGASYPPITVTVNVAASAASPQVNLAQPNTDATVPDSTTIVPARAGYRYIAKVVPETRTMRVPRKP